MEPAKQETTAQAPVGALLWPSLPIYQMYGANTDVGKTVFSTILCKSANRGDADVAYLKPVSTGPVDRADLGCKYSLRIAALSAWVGILC